MTHHHGSSGASAPHLLQQMRMMLQAWRGGHPTAGAHGLMNLGGPTLTTDNDRDTVGFNIETAKAVLKLYSAAAGAYEPLLTQLHDYVFATAAVSLRQCDELSATAAAAPSSETQKHRGVLTVHAPAAAAAGTHDLLDRDVPPSEDRAAYAMIRVERTESQMKSLAAEARQRQTKLEEEIASLGAAKRKIEDLLEYQIQRYKNRDAKERLNPGDFEREVEGVELARKLEEEQQRVVDRDREIERLGQRISNLLSLNGKYARQAIELAARLQVYSEQNDKFATLLSLQHDEKLHTDRENELLRAELTELNRFHQLRDSLEGETATVSQTVELRGVRLGMGVNSGVPRHLQFKGLMNRVSIPRDAAVSLVSDMLIQRHAGSADAQKRDLGSFIHAYLTKKHGADAAAWAYSIDESTRFYDSDCNLNLFGLVSRRMISEGLYREISVDVQMLMEGCEAMDLAQHGDQRLSVPVKHVLGLLLEMYPSYPDTAFRRIFEFLLQNVTATGHAHYRMLFPNLEREEITQAVETTFSAVELRNETMFSASFKELIVDDACITMQALEDVLADLPQDSLTLTHILNATAGLYDSQDVVAEVHAALRHVILEHLGAAGQYEVTLPKTTAIQVVRQRLPLRRGVFRFDTTMPGAVRLPSLLASMLKGDLKRAMDENCVPINYVDLLQRLKHRRHSYVRSEEAPDSPTSPRDDGGELLAAVAAAAGTA